MAQIRSHLDNLHDPQDRYEVMPEIARLYDVEEEFLTKFSNFKGRIDNLSMYFL